MKPLPRRARAAYRILQLRDARSSVLSQQKTLCGESSTKSLADTLDRSAGSLTDALLRLGYVEGSSGLAVAIGDRLATADVFRKFRRLVLLICDAPLG